MGKPVLIKLGSLHPNYKGVTSLVRVLDDPVPVPHTQFYEMTVADDTARVVMSLKESQVESQIEDLRKDKILFIRNASCHIVNGYIRLSVDKWGKLDLAVDETVEEVGEYNMSGTEFELVNHS